MITSEKTQIIEAIGTVNGHFLIVGNFQPLLVRGQAVTFVVTHAREQNFVRVIENVIRFVVNNFVFIADPTVAVFRSLVNRFSVKLWSKKQRTLTVLLAVEVRNDPKRVARIVHVDGWICIRPNQNCSDCRKSNGGKSQSQNDILNRRIFTLVGVTQAKISQCANDAQSQNQTWNREGQTKPVDASNFEVAPQSRNARNDEHLDDRDGQNANHARQ